MMEALRNGKRKAVLEALGKGCTRRAACRHAGVSKSMFYAWLDPNSQWYDGTLSDAVEKAEQEAECGASEAIQAAWKDNWTAAAWFLERRYPVDFGRRDTLTVLQQLAREIDALPADELAALAFGASGPSAISPGEV